MRWFQLLQLSAFLTGLSLAVPADKIPLAQLEILALGLARLVQRTQNKVRSLERQGDLLGKEIHGATKTLGNLQEQTLQARRTQRQVRKDLQIQTATIDRLGRFILDLQKEMEDLDSEQESMQLQMNQIIHRLRCLKEPGSRDHTKLGGSTEKVLIDKQARILGNLTAEVSAWDRIINRRLEQLRGLEKRLSVSKSLPAPVNSDYTC